MLKLYFIVISLFSSLYLTSLFNSIGSTIIATLIVAFYFVLIIFKKEVYRIHQKSLLLFYILLLSGVISTYVNSDWKLLFTFIVLFLLYLASTVGMSAFNVNSGELIYKSVFITHIPLIVLPLLFNGMNQTPYRGIFYNPNSLGSVAVTLFGFLLATFLYKIEQLYLNRNQHIELKIKLHLLCLVFLIILIVASGSRTSALTTVGMLAVGLLLAVRSLLKYNKAKPFIKAIVTTLFSGIIILLGLRLTPFYDYLNNNIIDKFVRKASSGDVLDLRGTVWQQTIREARAFGNGSNYFLTQTQVGSHSTYFSILGEYGWIPFILFIATLFYILLKNLNYAYDNFNEKYKYLPLFSTLSFVILSFAEGMMFKLSMISMFFLFGNVINNNKSITS